MNETPSNYFNVDNMKSYATEENLIKALNKLAWKKEQVTRAIVVCNRSGRFTAFIDHSTLDGNMTAFPGFLKI